MSSALSTPSIALKLLFLPNENFPLSLTTMPSSTAPCPPSFCCFCFSCTIRSSSSGRGTTAPVPRCGYFAPLGVPFCLRCQYIMSSIAQSAAALPPLRPGCNSKHSISSSLHLPNPLCARPSRAVTIRPVSSSLQYRGSARCFSKNASQMWQRKRNSLSDYARFDVVFSVLPVIRALPTRFETQFFSAPTRARSIHYYPATPPATRLSDLIVLFLFSM